MVLFQGPEHEKESHLSFQHSEPNEARFHLYEWDAASFVFSERGRIQWHRLVS
jgi:hypothetical protein